MGHSILNIIHPTMNRKYCVFFKYSKRLKRYHVDLLETSAGGRMNCCRKRQQRRPYEVRIDAEMDEVCAAEHGVA